MIGEMSLKEILAEPADIDALHIPQNIVIDLIFRILFNEGNVSLSRFVEILKIPNRIIDTLLLWMQKEHLVEVAKVSSDLGRLGYSYNLTDAGEQRARDAFDRCSYIGPVPVSIPYYNRGIELQTQRRQKISSNHVKDALKGLILPDDFHRCIGPAINSGTSLFLYGPPGNGKTTIYPLYYRTMSIMTAPPKPATPKMLLRAVCAVKPLHLRPSALRTATSVRSSCTASLKSSMTFSCRDTEA